LALFMDASNDEPSGRRDAKGDIFDAPSAWVTAPNSPHLVNWW
jgi:hypothetical protein